MPPRTPVVFLLILVEISRTGYSSHEDANGSEIIDNQSELPSTSQDGNNHDLKEVSADILEGKLDDPIEGITKK